MDEYIVDPDFMRGFLIYFKNGQLHREAGPAIISIIDKEEYSYSEDKDLYREGKVKLDIFTKMRVLANIASSTNNKNVSYFIDGELFSKEKFYRIKLNKFKKELDNELITNKIETKKLKI
jgi:hypothetical protein